MHDCVAWKTTSPRQDHLLDRDKQAKPMFHVCSLVTLLAGASFLLLLTSLPQRFWFSAKTPRMTPEISLQQPGAPPYTTAVVSPRPCHSRLSAILGKRSSKRHLHPQNGDVLLAERWILQEHLGCNCMSFIFLFPRWGTSEVSKEERTVHCLSKLRNNWSHNKREKKKKK